jgi:hypothetical protein
MAFDPRQPFTRSQAREAGIGWRQLAGPRFQQLLHGIHIAADVVVTPGIRARAALLAVGGEGALYGVSAAEFRQLPVPVSEETHLLIAPEAPRVRRAGVVTHRGTRKLSSHRGIPLTTMVDTFVDVAIDYPLVDAVVLGDAMVREGYARSAALVRAAAARTGRGVGRARRAAALVRARARLPQETRLRLLIILSGLPEPEIGFEVTAAGRNRELDMAYPEWKVAVEYDGRHHVERDLQWSEDIERHEQLSEEDWNVVIVTGMQMFDPERVIARIRTALANARAPLPPISQEWRRHFPTRRQPSSER